jgi:hypothetical protein
MQFSIHIRKTETFYTAIAPALALVSYGQCREEAENNLQEHIRSRVAEEKRGTREERK